MEARHYRDRAVEFFQAMQLLETDLVAFGNAAALLAVHCCISMADALLVHAGGRPSRARDHLAAAEAMERLGAPDRLGPLAHHFKEAVSCKSRLEYGSRRLSVQRDIHRVIMHTRRFIAAVLRLCPELAKEGM